MGKLFQKLKKLNRQTNYLLGYLLMGLGIFIFVMYIPPWLWMVLLGIFLVIAGYYVNIYFK
ncbi:MULTISPECIES: hypothetical protein [Caldanaerobacter]|uniref:Uncharacterized protein n=4 Tax=Caldanaerobacter subterraneus TaxID=911092 RepID=Q8R9U0_CALS4|nr:MULTISPECIES: hypothetical protein [Caldanaerobacter]AAM24714.1 hypothetical protein TTE1496 [Caldanaerobacter subterraneus subsp. tengcongensis MB4]ERM92395.1 hypothetical protein O163_05155 [Caldanaerobacter subterraneus subsp. yonseiensis KB-1]KKC29562.1 hypothetical protein CDSM653_01412 [Caldanaerobacter subterraneus subsp. pacificus DSM 12653]MCS3915722.1 hypothetical protein [Caldanaerobacter subterraneus subsp. tengcongensis MB4]MDK2793858.1 hypothetical protein [Caldanaerobacter sp